MIRFPLPSVETWHGPDADRYAILSAPPGEEWTVVAHFEDGTSREIAPTVGVVSPYYTGSRHDSATEVYWDLDGVDAADFEIFRPDSEPVRLSQVFDLQVEFDAGRNGWATAEQIVALLATRDDLFLPDRAVSVTATGHTDHGDAVSYDDGSVDCLFHHFFDSPVWRASVGGWANGWVDLPVETTAEAEPVAEAIADYIQAVLWRLPADGEDEGAASGTASRG